MPAQLFMLFLTPRMKTFSIWTDFAAYSGPAFSTSRHSHFYAQLCLGSEGSFRLRGRDGVWRSYTAAFIPSGLSHETEHGEHAFMVILMDPLTTGAGLFADLRATAGEPGIDVSALISQTDLVSLATILQSPNQNSRADILKILHSHTKTLPVRPTDRRILAGIEKMNATGENLRLSELAASAGISPSRFRHLFREQTGTPLSAYKLWMKTKNAILFLSQRPDLSLAAYAGGFADQAHFSRIFRRSFGVSPSGFSQSGAFQMKIFGS